LTDEADEADGSMDGSRNPPQAEDTPYGGVLEAALLAVDASERARGLGLLDGLLKPWIRETLSSDLGLVPSADSLGELADDIARILGRGYRYCELRKELSQDGAWRGQDADAVWRIVDDISWIKVFAVAVLCPERTAFALRRTVHPGRSGEGTAHWRFSAMPHQRWDGAQEQREDFPVVVSQMGPDQRSGRAHVPPALLGHPVWVEQLGHGFEALGHTVSLS
jgi:hypothetical protein